MTLSQKKSSLLQDFHIMKADGIPELQLLPKTMNKRCLCDRSKNKGLVSVEWITNPSVVFDDCLSVIRLSWAKVDASSTSFFTSDTDGRLQYCTCLPLHIHVC